MPTEEKPEIVWKSKYKRYDDGRFSFEIEDHPKDGVIVQVHDRQKKKGIRVTKTRGFISGENPHTFSFYPLGEMHVLADDASGARAIIKEAIGKVNLRIFPAARRKWLLKTVDTVLNSNPHIIVARDLKQFGGHVIMPKGHVLR